MNTEPKPLARVLPRFAAEALQKAALTPIPENDPLVRLKAIEKASEWVRHQYPRFFRKEIYL